MNKEVEIWKDVEGYDGIYQISNFGKVKSFYTNIKEEKVERYLAIENRGPLTVVFVKDSIKKTFQVKKLVAEYFVSNPENKKLVLFIDNKTKSLNYLNLKWGDKKEVRQNIVTDEYKEKVLKAYSLHKGTIKDFAKLFTEFSYITIGKILRESSIDPLLHNEEKVVWETLPELSFGEKVYEVSNTGQVRKQWNGQILKRHWNGSRYVTVLTVDKKTYYFQTHLLVAKSYLVEYNKSVHDVIHFDKDLSNNNVTNLRLQSKRLRGTYLTKKMVSVIKN